MANFQVLLLTLIVILFGVLQREQIADVLDTLKNVKPVEIRISDTVDNDSEVESETDDSNLESRGTKI